MVPQRAPPSTRQHDSPHSPVQQALLGERWCSTLVTLVWVSQGWSKATSILWDIYRGYRGKMIILWLLKLAREQCVWTLERWKTDTQLNAHSQSENMNPIKSKNGKLGQSGEITYLYNDIREIDLKWFVFYPCAFIDNKNTDYII